MRDAVPLLTGIDACVTDPPYHLTSIVKRFGSADAAPAQFGTDGAYARASRGFMGKQWDGGDVAFRPETWRLVFDALKPGAHLIAFSGTRTYHRMACAIEDAGFEIRDQIGWLYGSGFPKSHDVSKGIDKAAGAERARYERPAFGGTFSDDNGTTYGTALCNEPATDAAREWQGWGTALKPAWEPIVLARKPLIGTVAANVLQHGTGAINVDACRVATDGEDFGDPSRFLKSDQNLHEGWQRPHKQDADRMAERAAARFDNLAQKGRWPANVIHDGSEEVLAAFPDTQSGDLNRANISADNRIFGKAPKERVGLYAADSGSAARFFYSAKADAGDRLGSKHPTVKPIDLMAYLCRLITPPGGTVLDPFAGSGTTGMAAIREGFKPVLIEREAEYFADACNRIRHIDGSDTPLFAMQPAVQEPLL